MHINHITVLIYILKECAIYLKKKKPTEPLIYLVVCY